jgi:thiamine biosynthesis protein ThiI
LEILVRYHEIALKGRNRPFFVSRLARNIERATSDLGPVRARPVAGRLSLSAPDEAGFEAIAERLERVFGVANFSLARRLPRDQAALEEAAVAAVRSRAPASFRITTRRSDKDYPLNSGQVDRQVGAAVCTATGVRVDLERPELNIHVEVLHDRIYYAFEKRPGPGGFPVGGSGRVAALLSGGIDSPVAAWRMIKRGCNTELIHFHAFPLLDRTTIDKARELARRLARYQYRSRLHLVPFGSVQQTIVAEAPPPLRVVLYRRFMIRIAERIAERSGARALVTGESVGQVASQTIENMAVIDAAARGPVLRPLVGMDKDEITAQARAIGTFEVSTLPDQDCCQLFVPRSPATAARLDEVERAEAALDVETLVVESLREARRERFEYPLSGAPVEAGSGIPGITR